MHYSTMKNKDIEAMMLKSTSKWKSKEVAGDLAGPENIHSISRRIDSIWAKRKLLLKNPVRDKEALELWREESFEIPDSVKISGKGGRPQKRLSDDPESQTENKILDPIIAQLEKHAAVQNVDPGVLLDKLVDRSRKKWREKEKKEKAVKSVVPLADACAMIYNVNLSLHQYQKIRTILVEFGIPLPTRNDVHTFKNDLMCSFMVESTKTSCEFSILLKDTVESLFNVNNIIISNNDCIEVDGKLGIDGSGSHQIRHQLAEAGDDLEEIVDEEEQRKNESSYLGVFWCPLNVKVNNLVVWTNILPNSTMYSRPLCLVREKENRESVLANFQPYIDEAERLETPVQDQNFNGHCVDICFNTELSMVDGKMVDLIQGDSGSFCHYCNATRKQANDLTCIM